MGENIVKMETRNSESTETSKLSYKELERAAQNISAQYQNLRTKYSELTIKYQELVQNNYFIRLDWLYKVIHSDRFPKPFIDSCIEEFITMMTPEQENSEENKD